MATADRPEQPRKPVERPADWYCGANRRSGGTCRKRAGFGTDHVGFGSCNNHAGSTTAGKIRAGRLEAKAMAASVAEELDLDPYDALLWCVRLAAGELAFFTAKAAGIDNDKIVVDHMRVRRHEGDASSFVERTSHSDLSIWVRSKQEAMERLVRFTKAAIDAGVAERHVRVAERYGELIGRLLEGVLHDLKLTDEQAERAPAIVRQHLTVLEGGKAVAA